MDPASMTMEKAARALDRMALAQERMAKALETLVTVVTEPSPEAPVPALPEGIPFEDSLAELGVTTMAQLPRKAAGLEALGLGKEKIGPLLLWMKQNLG